MRWQTPHPPSMILVATNTLEAAGAGGFLAGLRFTLLGSVAGQFMSSRVTRDQPGASAKPKPVLMNP